MDFKERIFQARKAKGFSQEDLAELVGVSRQAVSKWETGEAMPDTEKLIALCQALELDMEYLTLGKESLVSVPEEKTPRKWITAAIAVVCLGVGILAGYLLPKNASLLDTIEIFQTTVTPLEGNLPMEFRDIEIAIYPNKMPKGLAVAVMYGEVDEPDIKICSREEDCYRITLRVDLRSRYRVTALLTLDGRERQIRILDIYGDESDIRYEYIS